MDLAHNANPGVRILSFDSGGPGTYSQLLIVREYMTRLANDANVNESDLYPADYFDLMGGVGFGGLAALMIGHLRMNVEEAVDALLSVASAVFPSDICEKPDLAMNTKHLKEAVEEILQARDIPLDMKMNDNRSQPANYKVALYAATSANVSHPTIFRTYPSRGSGLNPTIADAICATMTVPSFFSPVKIGPRMREQKFIGGALGANNPTRELLKEANLLFGKNRRVAQILSIGSGHTRELSLDSLVSTEGVTQLLRYMAADCEMLAKELSTRLFNVNAYLRLNVDRGMENINMDDWTNFGSIESHTSAYLETTTISEAIETSLRRLRERHGTATLGQINYSSTIRTTIKTAPTVTPYYVLRRKEWRHMLEHLVGPTTIGQKVFPITGMGGCGKTQMVSYFLRENQALFTHVVYVDASSQNSIKTDLQAWAQALGDGHEQDVWEDALRILANGPHNGKWALILDNADDLELDLPPFFPKCHNGIILITSRNRDVGNLANTYHLELGEMETGEALSALLQASRRQQPIPEAELESAHRLINELGFLAVAVINAGTYCHQLSSYVGGEYQPYTFTKYLSLFYSQRAALMKKAGPSTLDGYRRGVYTTLDLSYQAIPQRSKEFLHVIAHLHRFDISMGTLAFAAENDFKDTDVLLPRPDEHRIVVSRLSGLLCVDGAWSELQVQDTIQTLRSFSVVSTAIVADTLFIQLHPLVQAWARDMVLANAEDYRNMACQILTSASFDSNVLLYRYLVPHINDLILGTEKRHGHVNDKMAAARVLLARGHYQNSEILFAEVLRTLREISTGETRETLRVAGLLAESFRHQGLWDKAEKLEAEVWEQCKKLLGKEHPDTIKAAENVATTYHTQGRWDEAQKLWVEVLEQRKRILGEDHPDTLVSGADLASSYSSLGRHEEAEKLKVDVLERRRRVLGREHPDTLISTGNLAATYQTQGRYDEAEKLKLEVLEQTKRVLGPDHPSTMLVTGNLAITYSAQKRWGEAEVLQSEVLNWRRRNSGVEHPNTILAAHSLAVTLVNQGKYQAAEALMAPALKSSIKTLSLQHPHTQHRVEDMIAVYQNQGKWREAEETKRLRPVTWPYPTPRGPFVQIRIRLPVTVTFGDGRGPSGGDGPS